MKAYTNDQQNIKRIRSITSGMTMEYVNGYKVYTATHEKTGDVRVVIVDGAEVTLYARFADATEARTGVHNRLRVAG